MNIQSLSIVVPTKSCWNDCAFCVSKMHHENYGKSILFEGCPIPSPYLKRIKFVRDEGCNSMILTGTAEPQQNLEFVYKLLTANRMLIKPFYNISIQTTGSNLTPRDIQELSYAGVTTLALSISSIDNERNWNIIHTPKQMRSMTIEALANTAKERNMNVRACLNLTDEFYTMSFHPESFFNWAKENNIDQLTFRKIYKDGENEKSAWISKHEFPDDRFTAIKSYIKREGTPISRLPYGFIQYSVHGISTVIDDNCMSKDNIDEIKYAILRPNGHLYSRWDDTGSLIF